MATDAPRACPFCSEPHGGRPEQCFRCEAPLAAWWPFEDAARRSLVAAPAEGRRAAIRTAPAVVSLVAAASFGAVFSWVGMRAVPAGSPIGSGSPVPSSMSLSASPETLAPPTVASGVTARSSRLPYRVQRGDSLWRIAAALTGDGRNWRTLWPERDPSEPLVVGTVIEAPLDAGSVR